MEEKILFAPLEGITGRVFRGVFHKHFSGVYEYYTPFLTPKAKVGIDKKDRKEILPENNKEMKLIPQILSSDAEAFLLVCDKLKELGYDDVNLNLGCPSGTVVNKGRGAGALKDLESLEEFLSVLFDAGSRMGLKISIKSRIGYYRPEEFAEILEVFKKFPFYKLIIHPRTRMEFYKGEVHKEAFQEAMNMFADRKEKLVFNGDILSVRDMEELKGEFPKLSSFMIGRGFLRNPFLLEDILNGEVRENKEERKFRLRAYLEELYEAHKEEAGNERVGVLKMKEIWSYLGLSFEDENGCLKEIRKAKDGASYKSAVNVVLSNCDFKPYAF